MSAKIFGVGRLGDNPKMDYTPKGTARTVLSLAVTDGFGDSQKTTWLRAVAFGKPAEILNDRVVKGNRLEFTAQLQEIRLYENSQGTTKYSAEVRIIDFSFIDSVKKETGDEPEEF